MTLQTNSFTICAHDGLCNVMSDSRLTQEKLMKFLEFVFEVYAPVVIISQPWESTQYSYILAQRNQIVSTESLLNILSRQEIGWHLSGNILYSPRPSKLRPPYLEQAISAARRQALVSNKV